MTPSPRPNAPKPGPRPGHGSAGTTRPVAGTSTAQPSHTSAQNDPAKYGRIADDGTVYLTTPQGERAIGEWKAGTAAEGLAHFGKRFDDLKTEIDLLAARLTSHPEEAAATRRSAEELKEGLPTAAVLGDISALEKALDTIISDSHSAAEKAKEDRARRRQDAIARKEKLVAEAQQIGAESTDWKAAGDRLREILDEWKTIHGIDRTTDDELWKKYSAARDAFNRRRGSHFADLDRQRAAARQAKEELCEKAEAIQDSTDWKETAHQFRDLMKEWKAAGRAPRDVDDKLWARFRAAQDKFFNARNAVNDARDKEFQENAAKKDALIAEYEPRIKPEEDLDAAKKALHELQEKWDEIGYVPRGHVREYEEKISSLEAKVSKAEEASWRRSDPELQARVAQFEAKVSELNQAAEAAEAKGNAKKAADLRAQAEQWSEWAKAAHSAVGE